MSGFEVENEGILTLIQDSGRKGYMHIGVTHCGAMDEFAYLCGNYLLGNDLNTNALEISFSGLSLIATENATICITGASFVIHIDGNEINMWQTHNIKKGSKIKFIKKITALRAYLFVSGGFLLEKELGSFSTSLKEKLGSFGGYSLKKGHFLPFHKTHFSDIKKLKKEFIPEYSDELELRVILGYQEENFSDEMKYHFFNTSFLVTNEANRMGMKLTSDQKIIANIKGIISEGIAFGAIQIPPDGNPIILLKDRQSIGGYPKIGSVLMIDCFKLAQAKTDTKIKFKKIDVDEARQKVISFYKSFNLLL